MYEEQKEDAVAPACCRARRTLSDAQAALLSSRACKFERPQPTGSLAMVATRPSKAKDNRNI